MSDFTRAVLASAVHRLKTVKVGIRITESAFAKWVCGEGAAVAELRFGARALVFLNDYNGRAMYLWGEHDPRITSVVDAVLQPGDTALDIGANFGVVGLFACKKVGEQGRVHMFEPQPLVAQCLRMSAVMNGYRQATIHECALSNRSGSAEMAIVDPRNMGMSTVITEEKQPAGERIQVRLEHAGDYVRALQCQHPALIKIDVEGHEGVILESMRDWIREEKPGVVLFECHLGGADFWSQRPVTVLSALGYELLAYDLGKYWSTRLYRVTKKLSHPAGHDFVAMLPGRLSSKAARRLESMIKPNAQA